MTLTRLIQKMSGNKVKEALESRGVFKGAEGFEGLAGDRHRAADT